MGTWVGGAKTTQICPTRNIPVLVKVGGVDRVSWTLKPVSVTEFGIFTVGVQ